MFFQPHKWKTAEQARNETFNRNTKIWNESTEKVLAMVEKEMHEAMRQVEIACRRGDTTTTLWIEGDK